MILRRIFIHYGILPAKVIKVFGSASDFDDEFLANVTFTFADAPIRTSRRREFLLQEVGRIGLSGGYGYYRKGSPLPVRSVCNAFYMRKNSTWTWFYLRRGLSLGARPLLDQLYAGQ